MKSRKIIISSLISTCLIIGCAAQQKKPEITSGGGYEQVKEYMTPYIQQQMSASGTVGLSIALVDDQEIVWAQGFGYSDIEGNVEATEVTVYRIGSVSKLFTATAVMQLAEHGKIDIDRPFVEYVPEFFIKTRFTDTDPITPRNMMTHHSGLPCDILKGAMTINPETLGEFTPKLKDEYASFPPNLIWAYSNLAVSLLGRMVETVSGQDFVSYTDEHILDPVGMENSSFELTPGIEKLLSGGYFRGKEYEQFAFRDIPAGGLYSNVVDLSRFMMMVFAEGKSGNNQVLEPETLAEMLTRQNANVKLDFDYSMGLNWILNDILGLGTTIGPTAWHDGSTVLFHSILITLPDKKLGVVVLTNSSEGSAITGKIAARALIIMLKARGDLPEPEQNKEPEHPSPTTRPEPETLKKYDGYYDTIIGIMAVESKRDKLRAKLFGLNFRLQPQEDGSFTLNYMIFGFIPMGIKTLDKLAPGISLRSLRFVFTEIEGRNVIYIQTKDKKTFFASKINVVPIPQAWMDRIGVYEVANQGDDGLYVESIRIAKMDKFLYVFAKIAGKHGGSTTSMMNIEPVSDTDAVIAGLGRYKGETVMAVEVDGEEMIRYSGYIFKRRKNE